MASSQITDGYKLPYFYKSLKADTLLEMMGVTSKSRYNTHGEIISQIPIGVKHATVGGDGMRIEVYRNPLERIGY